MNCTNECSLSCHVSDGDNRDVDSRWLSTLCSRVEQ